MRILSVLYDPSPYPIWTMRIGLDFSIRFTCSMTSGLAYVLDILFLRFGYNKAFYNFNNSVLSKEQFERTIMYTGISVGIEAIHFVLCAILISKYTHLTNGLTKPFSQLIKLEPGYFAFGVWATAHIITDVFLAQLNLDNWG